MTPYGYARVSVREPEDKNLDLQVERRVRAGCSLVSRNQSTSAKLGHAGQDLVSGLGPDKGLGPSWGDEPTVPAFPFRCRPIAAAALAFRSP